MNTLLARSTRGAAALVSALILSLTISGTASAGRLLRVTNLGNDRGVCGITFACRSITQAVKNAADGDSIEVDAGIYGQFTTAVVDYPGSGEEPYGVRVTKSLRIYSAHGAATTIIQLDERYMQPCEAGAQSAGVEILAPNVTFGETYHGFTIRGASCIGLKVDANGARIGGNIVTKSARDGFVFLASPVSIQANSAINNGGNGFTITTPMTAELGNTFVNWNSATDNTGSGFDVSGGPTVLTNNVATGNSGLPGLPGSGGAGFACTVLCTTLVLRNNDSISNAVGIALGSQNGATVIVHNSFIGNSAIGIILSGNIAKSFVFTENNIYDNGYGIDGQPCDFSVGPSTSQLPRMPNNFWGGGVPMSPECDDLGPGVYQVVNPVATTPFSGPP